MDLFAAFLLLSLFYDSGFCERQRGNLGATLRQGRMLVIVKVGPSTALS